MPEGVKGISSKVVAYHFCQADNAVTCSVPDFIHSIAAQLCQAPQLQSYRDLLMTEPQLQTLLSIKSCITDPSLSFTKGILEPLHTLRRIGKLSGEPIVLLIDGICEAEYHRPDNGDSLASFIAKHIFRIPTFMKIIVTVRTHLQEVTRTLPFHQISLDLKCRESLVCPVAKDLTDLVTFRCSNSPTIRNNITVQQDKVEGGSSIFKFSQHIVWLSNGSMLFLKLLLDLVERGHLIMKSGSFKVLPQSLNEVFLLLFNLRFPSVQSFKKVQSILNVCLAALTPMTASEIYYSINSGLLYKSLSWEEFLTHFKSLNFFLIKRLDESYMLFHPALREWLTGRFKNESTKFLCDTREGHACIALRLSRLEWPLDADKSLELGHHILKAHIYKNIGHNLPVSPRDLQALWIAQSSQDVSDALAYVRNLYNPNVKVSHPTLIEMKDVLHCLYSNYMNFYFIFRFRDFCY